MKRRKKIHRGITIVEILVSIAVALVFLTGINQLMTIGIRGSDISRNYATAVQLATEGTEAMYNIRKTAGWSTIGITGAGEYYQPAFSSSLWILGSKKTADPPDTLTAPYDRFTRIVRVDAMKRELYGGLICAGDVCDEGVCSAYSCTNSDTLKITVQVSWLEGSSPRSYQTETLLTNI